MVMEKKLNMKKKMVGKFVDYRKVGRRIWCDVLEEWVEEIMVDMGQSY